MKKQRFSSHKYQRLVLAVVILRLILGPAIFISVWLSSLSTFLLDWADSELFKRASFLWRRYAIYDKILDYYWYLFILAYIFLYEIPSRETFLILFLFRSIGQILFFLTKKEQYFFLFPNIFEILFYFYLLSLLFPKLHPYMYFPKIIFPLLAITPMVLVREYIAHIKKMNLSWFFTGKTTYWRNEKKNKGKNYFKL